MKKSKFLLKCLVLVSSLSFYNYISCTNDNYIDSEMQDIKVTCFADYEKLFKGDSAYDHNGKIYVKDISLLSPKEVDEFDDLLDLTDGFIAINRILAYKEEKEPFCQKLIFNEKAIKTVDGKFVGDMAFNNNVTILEKNLDGEFIEQCNCQLCCYDILYIKDMVNNIIIEVSYVESFEFTKDGKFVVINFMNGTKITYDLYQRKEVVSLRDCSKEKSSFFDDFFKAF